jgi:ABC-type bacteriocin/lantibiotic exporter with double-glycine peptidase domain
LSASLLNALLQAIFAFWNFLILFYYDVELALAATALVAGAAVVALAAGFVGLRYERAFTTAQGRLAALLHQLLTGISKIRVSAAESLAFSAWARDFAVQRAMRFKAGVVENRVAMFDAAYPLLSMALIFFLAERKSGLSTGELLAFTAALAIYLDAQLGLVAGAIEALKVVPLLERTKPILESAPELDPLREHPGELDGAVEVSKLSFRYSHLQPMVLDQVSFRVEVGELVAIVGPSGSGKSTLLRLLLGFEEPASGAIYYSGQNLGKLDLREVRRQLGVVMQNSGLMSGSIFDNVEGSRNLTREQVWHACEQAAVAADIREMPMRLETRLTHGGSALSGGQRQRLLIARAIATHPRILFLDEATSALDNEAQAAVMESLKRLRVTRVVIAHRLSTLRHADRILVIDKGRLVQEGKFGELLAVPGLFAELAKRQLA